MTRMKHASVRFATARAESVLPVPGGLLLVVVVVVEMVGWGGDGGGGGGGVWDERLSVPGGAG
jgi:hypothetical protein